METTGKIIEAGRPLYGCGTRITIETDEPVAKQLDFLMKQDKLRIKVVKYRKKRSIDANNYMWQLLSEMAPLLHTTKEELYLEELRKYGTFMYLPGTDEDMERLKSLFRIVINRGDTVLTTPSGKEMQLHQLQCYKGSSLYNTLEMSRLIDGVVQDAQDLGIDTATPDEILEMKERWGV